METADHAKEKYATSPLRSVHLAMDGLYRVGITTSEDMLVNALEDVCNVIEKDKTGKRYIIPADASWAIERAEQAIKKARGIK